MDVIVERCAGLDVHKATVTACVRTPGKGRRRHQQFRTYATFSATLAEMAQWLRSEGVTQVAMEATGVFWKPVWWVLEEVGFELLLVNATHVKKVPGRKTDVRDAEWLAQLLECGLLRASFVPRREIRNLRDLTRYRTRLVQERARETLRVHKGARGAGIKLAAVATDALGVSGRAMIGALVAGVRDPEVLAEMAKGKLRRKVPELRQALSGRFSEHHADPCRQLLCRLDHLDATVARLDALIDVVLAPHADQRDRLTTIPGVGKRAAEVILAEIGVDMGRFPTSAHLASWAGMCPGNRESAGKQFSGRTRKADPWLRGILAECLGRPAHQEHLPRRPVLADRRTARQGEGVPGRGSLHPRHRLAHPLGARRDVPRAGRRLVRASPRPQVEQRRLLRRLEALGLKVTIESTTAA